jgi:hypothetical protein
VPNGERYSILTGRVLWAQRHSRHGAVFDKACRSLHDTGQPGIVKEIIAKRIIALAREGDNDPDHLCETTLKALGFSRYWDGST